MTDSHFLIRRHPGGGFTYIEEGGPLCESLSAAPDWDTPRFEHPMDAWHAVEHIELPVLIHPECRRGGRNA